MCVGLHDRIAASHARLQRGRVWCRSCGRSTRVDPVGALRHGWPRCCDATMTIDAPGEREAIP
ncbi:hypothetical protein RLDS_10695 [Sphingobium lactosutens DS20]|uniref:Uncharacterized protein n=2 Tax=Sphingobium TaxID=165695 RepID=T0IV61_9SPHN|nr:hypothetical protein RLDS_10695 [Sphingobium lactosutens DS20]